MLHWLINEESFFTAPTEPALSFHVKAEMHERRRFMSNFKHRMFLTIGFMAVVKTLFSQFTLQGTVTDNGAQRLGNGAEPVIHALVTLFDQADSSRSYSTYTNEQGQYSIQIFPAGIDDNLSGKPGNFRLLQNYPNPFNPSTIIRYEITRPTYVTLQVYDVLGRKVKTLLQDFQGCSGQIIWDATNDQGQGVPAGVYFYSCEAEGKRMVRKMTLIDGHAEHWRISYDATGMPGENGLNKMLTDLFTIRVTADGFLPVTFRFVPISGDMTLNVVATRTVTDIEGNIYLTVKIGDQWWMMESLRVTKYRNGQAIPLVESMSEWKASKTGAYCDYGNSTKNGAIYGHLYNWYAATDSNNIAPTGWHVPSYDEWEVLAEFLGGSMVAGEKLKQEGTTFWQSPNIADNASGFSARPSGIRDIVYGFTGMKNVADFWTSTEDGKGTVWSRALMNDNVVFWYGVEMYKEGGSAIRCVRD
ncbi:MAG: T9SS C-terminal target domain-containing protein [Calditrichaeota bacterium]|nr:MAG: T9SS C-terminal target domain-containing protein [Calditrichota bacterium]